MANINNPAESQVFLCSNIMREPQVFEAFGSTVEGLARDIMIWTAWRNDKFASLNVKHFGEDFGYSKGFLFKPLTKEQENDMVLNRFNPKTPTLENPRTITNLLGYTLAMLTVKRLNFVNSYIAVGTEGLTQTRTFSGLTLIKDLQVTTTRKGTYFTFEVSKTFLSNCRYRFQRFQLSDYLSLKSAQGNAISGARKLYLHLIWKRKVWDTAKKQPGVKPSFSLYPELLDVAGIERADQARSAYKLRQLLEQLANMRGVWMTGKVEYLPEKETYTVQFKRQDTGA